MKKNKQNNLTDLSLWGKKVIRPYKEGSYCERRVAQTMGFTADMNTAALYTQGIYGNSPVWMPLFQEDENDNIKIAVYNLDRKLIQYPIPEEKRTKTQQQSSNEIWQTYYVTRTNTDKEGNENKPKYTFPSSDYHDQTYPYLPIPLIEKWEKGEDIQTLVLTEGYFKSVCGAMHGIDVIGLGSITLFENTKTHSIYLDIDRIIRDCNVKNIVVLYDGDCTNISEKDLERGDELTRRPRTFLTSLKRITKLLKPYKRNLWFMYVDSNKLQNKPKGLDDLLLEDYYKQQIQHIVDDINNPELPSSYFYKLNLNNYFSDLTETFHLESNTEFYRFHKSIIGSKEFTFNGNIYKWNESEHHLDEIISKELAVYIRVGTHYYKNILVPTQSKEEDGSYRMEHTLIPWSREAIKDDFGTEGLQKIRHYETFVNLPSHIDYKPVVNNCYNIYHPITMRAEGDPARKNWKHIDMILRHVFGNPEDEYEQYEMGLDYVQLLYQQPIQLLPILCLVSKDRNTGKSTFSEFLRTIFDRNVVIVGGQEMLSKFNSLVSGRLIVSIEEMRADKNKEFTERIKYLSTASKMPMESKGKDTVMVDNCTKYIINSNNTTRFIYTDDKEQRFWVRRIPALTDEQRIPNLMHFVRKEVPAFLTYLNQREMAQKTAEDRMYFTAGATWTPWLQDLFTDQRSQAEKAIRNYFHQWFIDFGREECQVTIKALRFLIPELNRETDETIRRILKDNMDLKLADSEKTKRYSIEYLALSSTPGSQEPAVMVYNDIGRPFVLPVGKFLDVEECKKIFER